MKIQVYQESLQSVWDSFVRESKNGIFLFLRDYMDYHRDRFPDYSLLIWNDHENLVALLPANRSGTQLQSHGGLTHGGFLTSSSVKVPGMLDAFDATLAFLKERGFETVLYKTVPHIYHCLPAEEDRYPLFLCNAVLARRGVLAVVDLQRRLPFQERRIRGVKKALKHNLRVLPTDDFATYWDILSETLWNAHYAHPVHRLEEITLLHSRFPANIRLFACYQGTAMIAGTVIYESSQVARTIHRRERNREGTGRN